MEHSSCIPNRFTVRSNKICLHHLPIGVTVRLNTFLQAYTAAQPMKILDVMHDTALEGTQFYTLCGTGLS